MNNNPLPDPVREFSWRRKLSAAEAAELRVWLAAHPEAQNDWDAESGLNEALGRLPDAPLASNFTARVLQAVEREAGAPRSPAISGWRHPRWWMKWLPRTAFAVVALTASLVGVYTVRDHRRVQEYRESVAAVSEVASLPSPEILQDFEAVRHLDPTPGPDEELLQAFQ